MKAIDIPSFARAQQALLEAELQTEMEETATLISTRTPAGLQRAGLAWTNLCISSQRTGLGGKTVVDLEPDGALAEASDGGSTRSSGKPKQQPKSQSQSQSQEHGIRSGDIVLVAEQPAGSAKKREVRELEKKGVRGVVVKTGRSSVTVALDVDEQDDGKEEKIPWNSRVWIVKLADDVTYKRMNQVMEKLVKLTEVEYTPLMRVIFGLSPPTVFTLPSLAEEAAKEEGARVDWIDPTLNDSQKEAILFALASPEVTLIHGPPGTGKTHTLIELILQLVTRHKKRVLVCGPSNLSVDNIVERLAPHKLPIVRLGHPARLLPSVVDHSLDVLTRTSDAGAIVQDIRQEMDAKQASIRKTRNGRERRTIYQDLRELRKDYRIREKKCVTELVNTSAVVLATLHGSGNYQLRDARFDVVIIDEASQALEAQCWVPLLTARKVICAGDHLQLPPTIKSRNTKNTATASTTTADGPTTTKTPTEIKASPTVSLETTLFDRLLRLYGNSVKRMLTTQYRMHEAIMRFPSDELYEGKLVAADAVKSRQLHELPYEVGKVDETMEPLIFYDTQGGDFPEASTDDSDEPTTSAKPKTGRGALTESKSNPMEAALVRHHLRLLIEEAGVRPQDIAVITPYNGQVSLLRALLRDTYPDLEIGSVDGFQGREKEAVIVSLVRSNDEGEVGFLAEKRRLNVAMTRPKRNLTIIGDSETVQRGGPFLKKWMAFLEEHADLRYPDVATLS